MKLAVTLLMLVGAADESEDPWVVLQQAARDVESADMLYDSLVQQADEALERRRERFEQLTTPEQCQAYQKATREFFLKQLGGFPERTPLDAQIVGRLKGDDYRVEKIIYSSRPQHHVTAALYLPNANPPYPAVLIACGHSQNGKAAGYNQRMGILLAKNGMAAMCYDPIGQGERSQIITEDGQFKHRSTTEHTLVGVGSILLGVSTAQFRTYDGIRGIDYLVSRPDIDPQRIGCTGCSGGGTLTSYIMALDQRVTCAAPACYITTFERLLKTRGPQDAEQNVFGQIAFGMDQTDYILMRAPKPTIICSTTKDFFDIHGSWDSFRQAKRFYARFGLPDRIDLVEDDSEHGVTKLNRETLTRWMQRWMLGVNKDVREEDFAEWTDEQLQCTPQGQVMLLPNERSVFDMNADLMAKQKIQRDKLRRESSVGQLRQAIRTTAAIRPLEELTAPRVSKHDTLLRRGYRVEKISLEPEPGILLPALAFVPSMPAGDAYVYLHQDGKQADVDGPILQLVRQGHLVLAADLRGLGELRGNDGRAPFGEFKRSFLAYLLGKSLVGLRAEDVLTCGRYFKSYSPDERTRKLHLIVVGRVGVPALHAAALEPELFDSVQLVRTLHSYEDVIRSPESSNQLCNVVHGALAVYDLPELVQLAGSDRVTVREPLDATENPHSGDSR